MQRERGQHTRKKGRCHTGLTLPAPPRSCSGSCQGADPHGKEAEEDQVPAHGSGRRVTRARTEALGRSAETPAPSCRLSGRRDPAPSFPLCPVPAQQGLRGLAGAVRPAHWVSSSDAETWGDNARPQELTPNDWCLGVRLWTLRSGFSRSLKLSRQTQQDPQGRGHGVCMLGRPRGPWVGSGLLPDLNASMGSSP